VTKAPIAESFDCRDSHPFDPKLGHCLFDLLELKRFDDGFRFFHVKVNSASRGIWQSKAKRSTRSLSNAAIASTIFLQWRCHRERSVAKSKYPVGLSLVSLLDSSTFAQNSGLDFAKDFFWRLY
jgi:hypothetical protein